MFATVITIALFSTLATQGVLAQDAFSIDTPSINQCQDVHITWKGGNAPYNLIAVPSDDPCESVLVELGDHTSHSITWKNTLPAGTKLMLSLEDASENEAWSGVITVGGGDASCLATSSSSVAPSSSSAPASTSVAPSPTASSSGDSSDSPVTTALTVAANLNTAAAASASSTSTEAAVPVGAANAGVFPGGSDNAAPAFAKLSLPALAVTALAAVFATAF